METKAGFDLEHAISQWRWQLSRQPAVTADEVREMEAHLRDSYADLRTRDLSEQEAFWIARHRLGNEAEIGEEFAVSKGEDHAAWLGHLWTKPLSLPWRIAIWSMSVIAGLLFLIDAVLHTGDMYHNSLVNFTKLFGGFTTGLATNADALPNALGILCLGILAIKLYFMLRLQKHRLLFVIASCVIMMGWMRNFDFNIVGLANFPNLVIFLAQAPVYTFRAFIGLETGEFFQDHLLRSVAFGWWLVAWGIIATRELIVFGLQVTHVGIKKLKSELVVSR